MTAVTDRDRSVPHRVFPFRNDQARKHGKLDVTCDVPHRNEESGSFEFTQKFTAFRVVHRPKFKPVLVSVTLLPQLPYSGSIPLDNFADAVHDSFYTYIAYI